MRRVLNREISQSRLDEHWVCGKQECISVDERNRLFSTVMRKRKTIQNSYSSSGIRTSKPFQVTTPLWTIELLPTNAIAPFKLKHTRYFLDF